MTTITKHVSVFDSDSHVLEPPELWEKYLDPAYRVLGKQALWRHEGATNTYLKINGEVVRDTMNPNLPRHAIYRPGMSWDDVGALDPSIRHPMSEGASDPRARLADMDAMGIDQAFLYPTWFAEGFHLVSDPDVAAALARAYNDWIAAFCQTAPRRLFAAAMAPLQDMDLTIAELRRVATIPCFRGAFVRPMFLEDHYFTSPYLRSSVGRTGTPRAGIGGASNAGAVEPGMDLAWTVRREDPAPSWPDAIARRRRRAILRRHRGITEHVLFHGVSPSWAPFGADPVQLARQSHVRCFCTGRVHRHATLPRT